MAAVAAKADSIISYTNTIPSTLTDWTNNVAFTQFNPSLGTLVSMSVKASTAFSTYLTVTNTGVSSSTGTSKTDLTLNFTGADDIFGTGGPAAIDELLTTNVPFTLSGGDGLTVGPISKSHSVSNTGITDSGILADFTGTGVVDYTASTYTVTDLSTANGNTSSSQVTDASGTFIITYDFAPAPAPEPSTFAMIGSGLAGLGLMIRRRSSK